MKVLYRHYKLTTKRNWHSQGSGPLGSGPIGPGSGYSVMPSEREINWVFRKPNWIVVQNSNSTLKFSPGGNL